jgi:hypothetical protein
VSWLCSGDQKEYIGLFMDILGEEGLRGDVLTTCTLEYLLKMCTVLTRAEEGEEEEDEGGNGESQDDGAEPITPF